MHITYCGSETQGEKAYKANERNSRSSSSESDSEEPRFKVQTPLIVENSSPAHISDATPRTTASSGSGMTALQPMLPNFGGVNISDHSTAGQYDRGGLGPSVSGSTTSGSSSNVTHGTTSFSTSAMHNISQGPSYVNMSQGVMGHMFSTPDPTSQIYTGSNAASLLPLLTIPEPPGLWYSSDTGSTWSTPSDQQGATFVRDRSASVATNPENYQMAWSPPYTNSSLQTPRTVGLDAVPESYESPPYLSPHISPNTLYPLAGVSSPTGGYQELVGIPTLSSPYKSYAQSLPAPQIRLSKSNLAGVDRRVVDAAYLVSPSGEAGTVSLEERMEEYLIAYRAHLEPVYSIVHPETFKSHPNDLLRKAMAALGSQFHILPGDREKGSKLHDSCLRMIIPVWFPQSSSLTLLM